jgi:glycerol-1-phosphate dehydrogenase [NAD(P)+]
VAGAAAAEEAGAVRVGLPGSLDLAAIREQLRRADPDSVLVPLELRRVEIGAGAYRAVVGAVEEAMAATAGAAEGGRVIVLSDATPILRLGRDFKELVGQELRRRFEVSHVVLDDGHPALHADEQVLDEAARAVKEAACVVTVGSGTITDIGKVASERAGGLPLVVVQTAASVDGFTDNVSVVLRSGVKRTIPSRWPDAVIADVDAISQAPRAMNTAGFGEVLSMYTAPADWYLASLVGLDSSFHHGPKDLLRFAADGLETWSPGLAAAEAHATERLVQTLAIRGIATGVAGTTACLSGVEHLVSHMLDLHHARNGLPVGLHGAQVGVSSLVAAAAWELLLEQPAAAFEGFRIPADDVLRRRVEAAFGELDAGAGVVEECWRGYHAKLVLVRARSERVTALAQAWDRHRLALRDLVSPAARLQRALEASGAPASFDRLDPVVPPRLAGWAVANCQLMRDRFTVVDLLDLLGLWDEDAVDRVLGAASGKGAGPAGEA